MGLFDYLNKIADVIVDSIDGSSHKQQGQGMRLKRVYYNNLNPNRNFVKHMIKIGASESDIIGRFDVQYLSLTDDDYIYLNNILLGLAPSYNRHIEYWLVKNDPQDPSEFSIYSYVPYGDHDKEYISVCLLLSRKKAIELSAYIADSTVSY